MKKLLFLWSVEAKKPGGSWFLWSVRTTRKDARVTVTGLGLGHEWRMSKWGRGAVPKPVETGNTSDVVMLDKLGRRKRVPKDWC